MVWSVKNVTPYGLDGRVQFPTGAADFSLLHSVQTDSGEHPFSYPVVNWDSCPEDKAARGWSRPLMSI
jgi:hypothetical protein